MGKVLDGVKVIDLTQAYNGPFCTMQLADHGAEVIKVEKPGSGDQTRGWAPFREGCGDSAYYAFVNRNKKGITLDITKPEGKKILKNLVRIADVVVENFRCGTMEKLGLGYEELKKVNPRIIYASSTGFGHYGPLKDRPAYDVIAQAMGGMMSITGDKGGHPVKAGPGLGDNFAGTYLAGAIAMALYHREKTGRGNCIDVSMTDVMFAALENALPVYDIEGTVLGRSGNIDPATSPYDMYECKDGFIVLAAGSEKLWKLLCEAMENPGLSDDERFADNGLRVVNRDQLTDVINSWTRGLSVSEAEARLIEKGVPCGPILDVEQIVNHPHFKAREMVVEVEHPTIGKMRIQGVTVKFYETPGSIESPAPLLGQHTEEVLKTELGLSDEDIREYREFNII
ncbi:MAG: CoA transferase [Syntrophomonadaceae bacterium]|nr:CoA transferase [Syntrophomonadaceae bacterium]